MKKSILICTILMFSAPGYAAEFCPGDLTGDCYVGLADLAFMARYWLTGTSLPHVLPDDMLLVPAGWFAYQNASPENYVFLDDFAIDKYEVTVAAYCEFLNDDDPNSNHWNTSQPDIARTGDPGAYSYAIQSGRNNYPVRYVSFYDAEAYAAWLSAQTGLAYRLPIEQEWEKAAGWDPVLQKLWTYGFQQDIISCDWCNYAVCVGHPSVVGYYDGVNSGTNDAKSCYGCYDMTGNVSEWTSSIRGDGTRDVRGGNYVWGNSEVTERGAYYPWFRGTNVGFRLVRNL